MHNNDINLGASSSSGDVTAPKLSSVMNVEAELHPPAAASRLEELIAAKSSWQAVQSLGTSLLMTEDAKPTDACLPQVGRYLFLHRRPYQCASKQAFGMLSLPFSSYQK